MNTRVVRALPGRSEELWRGETPVAPRSEEFLCLNPDDASVIVKRVDWDYSGAEVQLTIFVY